MEDLPFERFAGVEILNRHSLAGPNRIRMEGGGSAAPNVTATWGQSVRCCNRAGVLEPLEAAFELTGLLLRRKLADIDEDVVIKLRVLFLMHPSTGAVI
jgi:hypothetical protein